MTVGIYIWAWDVKIIPTVGITKIFQPEENNQNTLGLKNLTDYNGQGQNVLY